MNGISLLAINAHTVPPTGEASLTKAPNSNSGGAGASWSEVAGRIEKGGSSLSVDGSKVEALSRQGDKVTQLAELLKVQSELHRHQIRVEFLSKISESALATVRKLQQNQ